MRSLEPQNNLDAHFFIGFLLASSTNDQMALNRMRAYACNSSASSSADINDHHSQAAQHLEAFLAWICSLSLRHHTALNFGGL